MLSLKDRLAAKKPEDLKPNPKPVVPMVVSPVRTTPSAVDEDFTLWSDEDVILTPDMTPPIQQQIIPPGITKLSIGASIKLTKNYQSYEAHMTAEVVIDSNCDPNDLRLQLESWIRQCVKENVAKVMEENA